MTRLPDNLPDRSTAFGQLLDRLVGFLPPKIAFVLQLLSVSEKLGIDDIGADRLPDLPHGFADGIEKRSARILHEMPTIGNLLGMR